MGAEWIVVLSEARARILRGLPAPGEAVRPELCMKARAPGLRSVLDRPCLSRVELLGEDRRDFLREVVALLECHRVAGELDGLVIFATPAMLGLLPGAATPPLRARILCEAPRTFGAVTEAQMAEMIRRELERAGVRG